MSEETVRAPSLQRQSSPPGSDEVLSRSEYFYLRAYDFKKTHRVFLSACL
jgi:hypothetical protein